MISPSDDDIAQALMALARARGVHKSFCPSEAARRLSEDWRPLMGRLRSVALELPLIASQKGQPVDIRQARGPIRLSLRPTNKD